MVFAMLKTRLIREQDSRLHFEVMAWLIQNFGSPPRPPVPSPLHKSPSFDALSWGDMDTRTIFDWADDHFYAIKTECHMENLNILLTPAGDGLDAAQLAASRRLDALASGRNPYLADTQTKDNPQVFYDPRDCVEPGYFAARIILQLADIRISDFRSEYPLSPMMQRMVTLIAATYCRQGFTLANIPQEISSFLTPRSDLRAVPLRIVVNSLCYATCLGLRVRRQSAEQIIATYGTRMPKIFRRKVRQACRQIDSHAEDLAVLQILAEPRAKRRETPQHVNIRA
jgi:hypothetical protein